jgi:hypothetical protein
MNSCLDHAGLVSVGSILYAYVLDSISVFQGRSISIRVNMNSCLDQAGLVSVCPILYAYVLDSITSIFLGRGSIIIRVNVNSCLDHAGLVSVGPILDAYVLDSITSIFLGRSINALAGSPDGLTLIASTKFIEKHLLR